MRWRQRRRRMLSRANKYRRSSCARYHARINITRVSRTPPALSRAHSALYGCVNYRAPRNRARCAQRIVSRAPPPEQRPQFCDAVTAADDTPAARVCARPASIIRMIDFNAAKVQKCRIKRVIVAVYTNQRSSDSIRGAINRKLGVSDTSSTLLCGDN